jgi:hypothetical protein
MAFWGSSNAAEPDAATSIARQLRVCETALAGGTQIDHFFYAIRQSVEVLMELAMRLGGGPGRSDRDWDALTRILGVGDWSCSAVIYAYRDRLGCGAKHHKWTETIRRAVAAFREADGASAEAVILNRWERSRG